MELHTQDKDYTKLLLTKESVWWKKLIDVQAPYRWNLRRLKPGFVLDIGCGLGRNLNHLKGHGVGIDHNPYSVEVTRKRGFQAFTPQEFQQSEFNISERFDSILLSHVAEHMVEDQVVSLLAPYVSLLKSAGQVILITPQEYGFRTDETHIQLMDFERLRRISSQLRLQFFKEFSFPFPRFMGHFFIYNEFVSISKKP